MSEEVSEAEAPVQPDIPDHLKGLSAEDLAKKCIDLERGFSQQGREFGELRKLTDQILKQQAAAQAPKEVDDGEVDFFDDPAKFVDRRIEEKLKPVTKTLETTSSQSVRAKLDSEFPKWQETISGKEFQDWVAKSPVRVRLYQEADRFDYDSAKELIQTWDDVSNVKSGQAENDRKAALSAAKGEAGGSGEKQSRKVFKRADLIRLRMEDRERFNSMSEEINKAYREGRVK